MTSLLELFNSVSLDIFLESVPIVLSTAALIVSIVVAWSNRKSLHVEISKNAEVIQAGTAFFLSDKGEPASYSDALLLYVEVVNPSPKDIAYFDLRAFRPDTNINVDLLTRRSAPIPFKESSLWREIENHPNQGDRLSELIIPDANYGTFKSNTFTRMHILIFPDDSDDKILFSFKVAMRSKFRKDPFAVTGRKKFRMYGTSYNISSWKQQPPQPQQPKQQTT